MQSNAVRAQLAAVAAILFLAVVAVAPWVAGSHVLKPVSLKWNWIIKHKDELLAEKAGLDAKLKDFQNMEEKRKANALFQKNIEQSGLDSMQGFINNGKYAVYSFRTLQLDSKETSFSFVAQYNALGLLLTDMWNTFQFIEMRLAGHETQSQQTGGGRGRHADSPITSRAKPMKRWLCMTLASLLPYGLLSAQSPRNAAPGTGAAVPAAIQTAGKPIPTAEGNPILKGAELKTEWANARNPFRFEVTDSPSYSPERLEQMQVLGYGRMPDEKGILRTYAFATKTTEGARVEGTKLEDRVTKDVVTLQALPEKLDEQTLTTEEQIEESSILLGNEQLWFLGVLRTNGQAMAIFLPDSATYPIQEEDLRPFEIQDSLKEVHVRTTKAGERISTADSALGAFSRRKPKNTPARPAPTGPVPPTKPPLPDPKAKGKVPNHANPDPRGSRATPSPAAPHDR